MYLGQLGNGPNGYRIQQEKKAGMRARCAGGANILPSKWTAAKYPPGMVPNVLPKESWAAYVARMKAAGYPPFRSRYWFECAAGYPMYWNWRIQSQVQKTVPTAEETAEAFVEEVKKIAPAPPVEGPTVITAPPTVAAPAPPPPKAVTEAPTLSLAEQYALQQEAGAPTVPVDSVPQAAPPAAETAAFPLMEQYRRQFQETEAQPAADATPQQARVEAQKRGAGIGTILAVGIPLALAVAGAG